MADPKEKEKKKVEEKETSVKKVRKQKEGQQTWLFRYTSRHRAFQPKRRLTRKPTLLKTEFGAK